MHLREATGLE